MVWPFSRQVKREYIFIFILNLAFLLLAHLFRDSIYTDPDRFYHYFISQEYLKNFAPDFIDRIYGLNWDKSFPEKEFLYHVLGSLFLRFGSESALQSLSLLLGIGTINIWYVLLRKRLSPSMSFTLIVSLLICPQFLLRLLLIRPHTLAIFVFALICLAGRGRKWKNLFVFSIIFSLSYHTIYIPIAFFILLSISLSLYEKRINVKAIKYGTAGIITGLFLNPYFPESLEMSLKHLWIALQQLGAPDLAYGPELAMQSPLTTIKLFLPFLVLGALCIRACWRELKEDYFKFLLIASLTCFLSLFISIRFLEYTPSIFTFIISLSKFPIHTGKKHLFSVLLCGLFTLANFNFIKFQEDISYFKKQEEAYKTLLQLPPKTDTRRIYNCDWWQGQYALYYSQLKVLDVLDPSLLMISKDFFTNSYNIKRGFTEQPEQKLKDVFNTDLVICSSKRQLFHQLVESKRIKNKAIIPIDEKLQLGMFEIK